MVLGRRLFVYDIRERVELKRRFGQDPRLLLLARLDISRVRDLGRDDAPTRRPTCTGADGGRAAPRVTRDRRSLNPLWGPSGMYPRPHERAGGGRAVATTCSRSSPTAAACGGYGAAHPVADERSGPARAAANGGRLLAEFVGQDTASGSASIPRTGGVRALSPDSENGLMGADLSADGRTVLGHTGGPDPAAARTWWRRRASSSRPSSAASFNSISNRLTRHLIGRSSMPLNAEIAIDLARVRPRRLGWCSVLGSCSDRHVLIVVGI